MRNDASYGSYLMGEDEFVAAVEENRYANAEFRHSDHIRLAWIYVRRYGARQAEEHIAETVQRFAISHGHERKYHETLTRLAAAGGGGAETHTRSNNVRSVSL